MSRMPRRIGAWRLRRILAMTCGALVALSILMFFNLQVSVMHGGTVELINGRSDTQALAVPLALFIVGAGGLMAALGWRPEHE